MQPINYINQNGISFLKNDKVSPEESRKKIESFHADALSLFDKNKINF